MTLLSTTGRLLAAVAAVGALSFVTQPAQAHQHFGHFGHFMVHVFQNYADASDDDSDSNCLDDDAVQSRLERVGFSNVDVGDDLGGNRVSVTADKNGGEFKMVVNECRWSVSHLARIGAATASSDDSDDNDDSDDDSDD
jgi:hypothetical protein